MKCPNCAGNNGFDTGAPMECSEQYECADCGFVWIQDDEDCLEEEREAQIDNDYRREFR